MSDQRYNRPLHYLAIATAVATFPLIFMGGLVTSHEAGMSVPDWPNSWGYNMFLFPPRLWMGGIFYEHTHRLMGTVVGMLSIGLVLVAWSTKNRPRVRWLCAAVLGAVVFQGVLGGLRVVLVKLNLAIVHACVAQAFFCLAAFTALATSRWWIRVSQQGSTRPAGRGLIFACGFATVAIYGQLVVGATMRHYQAGLAVPDFPLAYGQILPATDPISIHKINQERIWKLDLPTVTANQVRLNLAHRAGALVVSIAILLASGIVLLKHRDRKALLIPAILLPILLAGQITLGAYTVLLRKPADIASLHVAVGALTLVTAFVLCASSIKLLGSRRLVVSRAKPQAASFGHGELVPA